MIRLRQSHLLGRLSVRFAMLLAVALLPLSIVSLVQTWSLQQEALARTKAMLLGETLRAATVEVGALREAQGMVSVMATVVGTMLDDDPACIAVMKAAVATSPVAAVAGFVRKDGTMTCASTGISYQFRDDPVFRQLVTEREPGFHVNRNGPVSGTSVLGLAHPVFFDGVYMGYVGLSLRHDRLIELDAKNIAPDVSSKQRLLSFWTFDGSGKVLTANAELDEVTRNLPTNSPLTAFVGGPSMVFQDASPAGDERTFALVPLIEGKLYLMSSWFLPEAPWGEGGHISPYLPTILMFTLGLLIAAWSAETLVTRHIRVLRQSLGSFARGERRMESFNLRRAPEELSQLAASYMAMTESVTRGEMRLEDSAHQKEVLLREVHHRVKNNLQLISSIMSIQMRRARSEEARSLLRALQDRVISLATIHRELYQTSGLADVRADELFPDIMRQIIGVSSGSDRPFSLDSDIDDLRLVPDQVVPLSLLLAEALANALKHSDATEADPGRIRVRLKRLGGSQAVLEMTNDLPRSKAFFDAVAGRESGVGSQLIAAFALQLGGELEVGTSEGLYRLKLTFTVAPLAEGEDRSQTSA